MLDGWAIADTSGHLLGVVEGSLEDAHARARALAAPGASVFLDGMESVYEGEGAPEPELGLAANATRAQRRAAAEKQLRVLAPETPRTQQPELAALALGFTEPIETDEVLDLTIEEAHDRLADFFAALPPAGGGPGKKRRVVQWLDPYRSVEGMLGGNYKINKLDPRQERARAIGLNLAPNVLGFKGPLRPRAGETLCLRSTPECRATCLVYTGQNVVGEYAAALKDAKTKAFLNEPVAFARLLHAAIGVWSCELVELDFAPYVRLNVYADIPWELVWPGLFEEFPRVQFYDYTKVPGRRPLPANYDLTFSYSGRNQDDSIDEQRHGRRIATVFLVKKSLPLPATWNGLEVVNGEQSDLRPLDPPGVCVGLYYRAPLGRNARLKPSKRDVFVVPCEILDDDRVVVALGRRHTFAFGDGAAEDAQQAIA